MLTILPSVQISFLLDAFRNVAVLKTPGLNPLFNNDACSGKLYWIEQRGEKKIRHNTEPGATFGKRAALNILKMLPIDWLL